jgi:uncharacterized protein YoxC
MSNTKTETFLKKFTSLVVEHFATDKINFIDVKLKDGTMVTYDGDMPMVGIPVFVLPSDGTDKIAPADGVLEFEDGTKIEVKDGIIIAVMPMEDAVGEVVVEDSMHPKKDEMENKIPATEQSARRLIESNIKETIFTKDEVLAMFKSYKNEISKDINAITESNTALLSANESLTNEIAKVSASNEMLVNEVKNISAFSKELPKLLAEFGATPQVTSTNEEKKVIAESFQSTPPSKLTDAEWKKKYMKY